MEHRPVIHSTFVIERSYPSKPERVFAALTDPAKKRRWFGEGGDHHDVDHYELDSRVGGKEQLKLRFKAGDSPVAGMSCVNDGYYLDIIPDQRVVMASSMTIGGRCISASLVTFELVSSEAGTDLIFTHQGAFFEGADGPVMREAGWRELLENLSAELTR
jgi:uncharacterized protein YndB with AHSA1/START domain